MLAKPSDAIGLVISVLDKQEAGSYDEAVYTRLTTGVADSWTYFWVYLAVGGIEELTRLYLNYSAISDPSDASEAGMYIFIEIVVMAVLGQAGAMYNQ